MKFHKCHHTNLDAFIANFRKQYKCLSLEVARQHDVVVGKHHEIDKSQIDLRLHPCVDLVIAIVRPTVQPNDGSIEPKEVTYSKFTACGISIQV